MMQARRFTASWVWVVVLVLGAARPASATFIDLTSVTVQFDATNFFVTLNFSAATPVLPPSALAPNSVVGFVDFDLDRNSATGDNPGQVDTFRPGIGAPPSGLGVDAYVLLGSELAHPGLVDLYLNNAIVGTTAINYTPTSLSFSFARSLFGGAGVVDFAAIVGDFQAPTDSLPVPFGTSSAVGGSAVPLPPALLCGIVGAALAFGARMRRAA